MPPIVTLPFSAFEPVGRHLVRIDRDTIFVVVRGSLTRSDVQELFAIYRQVQVEHGRLLILYDAREAGGIDADARQYAASVPATTKDADLQVVFGLSFGIRAVLNMVLRAQKLLRNRSGNFHIFDTEANARTFFDADCERIRQEHQK